MRRTLSFRIPAMLLMMAFAGEVFTQDSKSVWDGVYTASQAMRGKDSFATHCASCHADLTGMSAPALKGDVFLDHWRGQEGLNDLFRKMKTMPPGNRERPAEDVYIDILSYMLEENTFPAGAEELKADLVGKIRITAKDGTEEVPDFALVEAVGCLTQRPDGQWILDKASAPSVIRNEKKPGAEELNAAASKPLGNQTFLLLYADSFTPGFQIDSHKGHKLQGKGFLIRNPNDQRLSVTWMEMIASTCP